MEQYRIQLHPIAAPFTVLGREALDRILTFYKRLKKAQAVAYPYFLYPQRLPTKDKIKAGALVPQPAIIAEGSGGSASKSGYLLNMVFCLRFLYSVEGVKGKDPTAEALDILSLIEEYKKLPQELE